ncbi:MAG TPA: hypothetical protein VG145_14350 [Xanthobacteraceae bacterium]|nr:hypothetical protein [Xanthobacteraceae bacterium]
MLLLLLVGVVFVDYRYGNGRLIDKASEQTTQLGYWLKDELGMLQRKIAPFR